MSVVWFVFSVLKAADLFSFFEEAPAHSGFFFVETFDSALVSDLVYLSSCVGYLFCFFFVFEQSVTS